MINRLKQNITATTVFVLAFGMSLALVSPFIVTAAPDPSDVPEFALKWGAAGSGNGQFSSVYRIATDIHGKVYVADSGNDRVQVFNYKGIFLDQWGGPGTGNGQFNGTYGIALDSSGNVYVVDNGNSRIQKFDPNGNYLDQWGSVGSGNSEFSNPTGIAIDSSNNVYVADNNNSRIQKFDSDGTYITQWGSEGGGNGEFLGTYTVAVDQDNNVYVVDFGNSRIQKFDSDGTYITQWGSVGSGNSEFLDIYDVSVDTTNNVYVADLGNNRVQKFASDGTYLGQWGGAGPNDGEFQSTAVVSADVFGNVYVADGSARIQKFSYPPETASLVSSESDTDIVLESAAFTAFSCSTSVTENALTTPDSTQDYPLGLVNFCLDVVPGSTNTVSLTFETDLSASEVSPRKYNPTTQTYTDIPDATITAATLNGNPALKLTYDITDGGELDDDATANGTILDPVGLAVKAAVTTDTESSDSLAETGQNQLIILLAACGLLGAGVMLRRRYGRA